MNVLIFVALVIVAMVIIVVFTHNATSEKSVMDMKPVMEPVVSKASPWDGIIKYKHLVTYMAQCFQLAANSHSERRRCGAILLKPLPDGQFRVISSGWNGRRPGEDNACEDDNFVTLPSVLHAERNAVNKVTRSQESAEGTILICTDSPCPECLDRYIFDSGIKAIFYAREYRLTEHLPELERRGIVVGHVPMDDVVEAFKVAMDWMGVAASSVGREDCCAA